MASKDEIEQAPTAPQMVLIPTRTKDYSVKYGKMGLGLFANRRIKKGKLVLENSLEFMFSDVIDGDIVLLDTSREKRVASKKKGKTVPTTMLLSRDVLTRTHGVPVLLPDPTGESAGIVTYQLEAPPMLMNHSCDPNMMQDSHDTAYGEDRAARKINKGDEITYNYVLQYYDNGPFFEECLCGSTNCMGRMMGFKALSDEEKEKYLPIASPVVQAMHKADAGLGPPVKREQVTFPPRTPSPDADKVMRLVFPGPSHALAKVEVKQNDAGEFGIYALKDFAFGEMVYEFWCQDWPTVDGKDPFVLDMVFSSPQCKGDPPEGTVVRLDARACALRNSNGRFQFSGWDLLTAHSCEPNVMYHNAIWEEDYDWREAYAAKDIKEGDQITVDFNSMLWDRTECGGFDTCNCGAKSCTGTMKGFKFLSRQAQEERKVMSRRRVPPPYDGEKKGVKCSKALSPHVRVSWRQDLELKEYAPDSAPSSSCSSSSSDESSDCD